MKLKNIKWKRQGNKVFDIKVICGCEKEMIPHPLGYYCESCKFGVKSSVVRKKIKQNLQKNRWGKNDRLN